MSFRLIHPDDVAPAPSLSVLHEVEAPRGARRVAGTLLTLFAAAPVLLALVPWRQSVSGGGRVVGYAPLDRQFNVEAPVGGRVRQWFVAEGSRVKKGDLVARISDNDLQFMEALATQLAAARQKLENARNETGLYGDVAGRFESVQEMAVKAAENGVEVARQKVRSEEQELAAATAAMQTDKIQFERLGRLLPQGLTSRREYELSDQKNRESAAKHQKAQASVAAAGHDLEAKRAYLSEVKAKTQAELEKARAEVQKATGKVAECQKEVQDLEVKIRRQQNQDVLAPRDGTILRLLVNEGSEQVKEGDSIATLVPDAAELAVELWVDGNDAPLVHPGDSVRLQFEGWPAVQFAGWPSVAVGSFGGRVALVDSADNGKGKFRVLIRQEPGVEWPSSHYLRQGVRAKGWVLLREVRLGYELWRRLNGFPQVVADEEPAKSEPGPKEKVKVKRPK